MLSCAVILGIVLGLLPTFGFAQTPPSQPNALRDLCFLLPKDIPWQTNYTTEGYFPDYSSAPTGKYCGGCGRGIANPSHPTAIAFLSVAINQFSTRERILWEVHQGRGDRKPNTTFGDGPATVYAPGYYSFPVGNYRVEIKVSSVPGHNYASRAPALAAELARSLAQQPNLCPGQDGTLGQCEPQSISAAELTGPASAELDSEVVRFSWTAGKFIRAYQLTVDSNPGGAMMGNFGPGKVTSASVKMPGKETPIYVTLFSFPECGNGPALSKSYSFRYPGPPGIK